MNNIDYNYYNKNNNKQIIVNKPYSINNQNKNNINNINLTDQINEKLNNLLDLFNPFKTQNREGFETNCPLNSDDADNLIESLRSSGYSLAKQNTYIDEIISNCSQNYNGVQSLINININDKLKNEYNRNKLLLQLENSFNTLDNSLNNLIYYITNYLSTGIHPLEKLNNKNSEFNTLYDNSVESYNFIKTNYGHLYNETPTEFIYGIQTILDIINEIKHNNVIKTVLQCNPFINLLGKYSNSLDISNINNESDNNVFLDSKYYVIKSFSDWDDNYNKKFIQYYKKIINKVNKIDTSGKIDIGGKKFSNYRDLLLESCEINETKYNYFMKFPNGYNASDFIKHYQSNYSQYNGLLIKQLGWCYCLSTYYIQLFFIHELKNHISSLKSFKNSIVNNSTSEVTSYIKELLTKIDTSIETYCLNEYIKKVNSVNSDNLKSNLTFRTLLKNNCYNSNYVECCYYLKTLNESTGNYYSECQNLDEITNLNKEKNYVSGVNDGLSQFSNNEILINLKYLNYYLCEMLRDSYCNKILTNDIMSSLNSETTDTRNTILDQSIMAIGSGVSTTESSTNVFSQVENFISGCKEGFTGNKKVIPGKIKFNDTVYNIIKNYDFNLDGKSQTLKSYTEEKLNESTCAPVNTPYFTANYKCGTVTNSNPISNATKTDHVTFDCSNPDNENNDIYSCNTFYLKLKDDGTINILKSNDNNNSEIYYQWKPEISDLDKKFILDGKMNESPKGDILKAGETLHDNEYITSKNKTFILLNQNGKLILKYKVTPCYNDQESNETYGYNNNSDDTKKSIGMYFVDNTNIKHIGKSGYVNLNGELQLYKNPKYTNTYLNVGNYTTSESSNNTNKPKNDEQILINNNKSVIFNTASITECEDKCNSFETCGGFVYKNGICMLKNEKMFPYGLKISDSSSDMYIRMKGVQNNELNKSCNPIEENANMSNSKFEEYQKSEHILSGYRENNASCDIEEASKPYLDEYYNSRDNFNKIKNELNNMLNQLTQKEKQILESYNLNVKSLQNNISEQDKIQKNTYKTVQNIDSMYAVNNDIHDSMNENLQYLMIYSTITLTLLGFTFAFLKK